MTGLKALNNKNCNSPRRQTNFNWAPTSWISFRQSSFANVKTVWWRAVGVHWSICKLLSLNVTTVQPYCVAKGMLSQETEVGALSNLPMQSRSSNHRTCTSQMSPPAGGRIRCVTDGRSLDNQTLRLPTRAGDDGHDHQQNRIDSAADKSWRRRPHSSTEPN